MSNYILDRSKVRAEHQQRAAFVYIRQSSLKQVRENLESQQRQYAFAEHARALGWGDQQVVVVDEDQGKSGATPQTRAGFARLVAAVARSEVGIVLSLEISRLSRNDMDWHHLVHLCRWTGTLIADEQGLYDPGASADRMLLGIRGQVSELERDNSVHRMVEARWNKARRGEIFTMLPAGYDLDDTSQISMTSDQAVSDAIRRVFEKFDELGTARQVFVWWHQQALLFPVRRLGARARPIVWALVTYRAILSTLHHPVYAGAYVFGRTETRRELDPNNPHRVVVRRSQRRNREDWPVVIRDHHPGYISFDKYLQNQERIGDNEVMNPGRCDEDHSGAPREGRALLQGLVRCGHCGRRMLVGYGGASARRTLQYRCRWSGEYARKECQLVGGKRVEMLVVKTFLEVIAEAGPEMAVLADQQLRTEIAATEKSWRLQIEKVEYEVQRAERQYMAVEPENRVVARELERRWNEKLEELQLVRTKAATAMDHRRPLNEAELARVQELGANLDRVWNAETTTARDRKRLLRCLMDEVQLRSTPDRYLVRIVWKGGATTDREVARLSPGRAHATPLDTVELVRQLAQEFDDTQIARILHRQGRRSGLDLAFTKQSVSSLRHHNKIPAAPSKRPRDEQEGPFTLEEAARELGVATWTVQRWLRDGVLAGNQSVPGAPWKIVLTEQVRRRLRSGDAPTGWVGLSEAARRLGLGKSHVAHLVKHGKLRAMRTKVGKRQCWRIDVDSATCASQADLFDPMCSNKTKES